MSEDLDSELKDMVFKKLEKTPFIRNVRAQLRAHIYNLIETGNADNNSQQESPVNTFLSTDNGRLALCLVEDLLEKLELKTTRTILRSESGFKAEKTTLEMKTAIDLPLDDTTDTPLLLQMLNRVRPEGIKSDETITLDTNKSENNSINETVSNSFNSI